jgi:hypothetical protein
MMANPENRRMKRSTLPLIRGAFILSENVVSLQLIINGKPAGLFSLDWHRFCNEIIINYHLSIVH